MRCSRPRLETESGIVSFCCFTRKFVFARFSAQSTALDQVKYDFLDEEWYASGAESRTSVRRSVTD